VWGYGISVRPGGLRLSSEAGLPVTALGTAPADAEEQLETATAPSVFEALATGPRGLDPAEVAVRSARWGPNTLARPPSPHLLRKLLANLTHVMAILLWIAGVVAFVAGLPELGIAIWTVNIINAVFSFWQEYRAERATEALRGLLPAHAVVLRSGKQTQVLADELVPGDVLILSEGDRVSADGRLVEQVGLRVDQSTLTGESRPVRKTSDPAVPRSPAAHDRANIVFAGTTVVAGRGQAVVYATGASTAFGQVATLTETTGGGESPLQREMRRLSYTVSVVAVVVGGIFFVLALSLGDLSFTTAFVFTMGMIVAFIPEGLLPTVTLSLAMATQRMAERRALVKRLSAVEALGSTTVICTDKTGTLTQNEMTVRQVAVADGLISLTGTGYDPAGEVVADGAAGATSVAVRMLATAARCSNARLVAPATPSDRWSALGDPTEAALLVAAAKAGIDSEALERTGPRIGEVAFDPVRKRMSTINLIDGVPTLLVKGAPAELLANCTSLITTSGVVRLPPDERRRFGAVIDRWSAQGYRVLGVAERPLTDVPDEPTAELERELSFLGLVAMHDPPRPEVADAVETCHRAGIRVIMITGDYGLTAETIGRRIGIYGDGPVVVINGSDLDAMDDLAVRTVLSGPVVFARATPEQKLRIVTILQDMGEIVAVTGDGVNDAPALKRADIGVAMGVAGTDVAKEAADMILLDDNFATIVAAVEEGRAVYANIKKFTTYILTSNTPEAVPFMVYAFSGGVIPIALGVMPILAVDLGTDMAPALALGAERPEPGVMDLPPRNRARHVIDRRLLVRAYVWLGPLQAAFVMAAFFFAYRLAGYDDLLQLPSEGAVYAAAVATALAAVVATQIGNLFTQRSERVSLLRIGLGGNRLLWWGIASEIVIIVAIVYVPFLNNVIGTAPFPAVTWLWLLTGIPLLPAVDEVRKAIRRRR
jgi:P-type Ca2+ transporter type 2C